MNRYVTRCLNCKQSYYVDEEDKHICFPIAPRAAEVGVRSATHAENLMILRARLSEHLSPVEDRELLAAAAALSSRPAIIEECARVCDELYSDTAWHPYYRQAANNCAETIRAKIHQWRDIKVVGKDAIRALAPREQNAAPQAGQPKSIAPSHEGHAAGPAVAAPNGAMDGDIVEFLCGGGTFKGCWYGGEKPSDEKGNFWWRKYLRAALRAAPSLTKEEAGAISEMLAWGIRKPNTQFAYSRCKVCDQPFWEREEHRGDCNLVKWRNALRAKLREHAEQEGKDG